MFTIIICALIIGFALGVLNSHLHDKKPNWGRYTKLEAFAINTIVISAIVLVICSFIWIGVYITAISLPAKRAAIELTIKDARTEFGHKLLEKAALTAYLCDFNKDLAEYKYWNNFWLFDSFVPDSVANLKFLL